MQTEYKRAYLTLARQNILPSNCLPASKHPSSENIIRLL